MADHKGGFLTRKRLGEAYKPPIVGNAKASGNHRNQVPPYRHGNPSPPPPPTTPPSTFFWISSTQAWRAAPPPSRGLLCHLPMPVRVVCGCILSLRCLDPTGCDDQVGALETFARCRRVKLQTKMNRQKLAGSAVVNTPGLGTAGQSNSFPGSPQSVTFGPA